MMPAMRAVASTSPFAISPAWMRANVSGRMTTRAPATATRSVSALSRDIDHAGAAVEVGVRQVRQTQQPPRRRRDIAGPHQRLADQEAARPDGSEPVEIFRIVNAAFADDETVRRHQRRQLLGGVKIDLQGLQVAVVDADQPAIEIKRAVQLGAVVHFDQNVEAELARRLRQGRAPSPSSSAAMINRMQSAPIARLSTT